MLRSIGKQSGEYVESVPKKNKKVWWEEFAVKEGFVHEWVTDWNERVRSQWPRVTEVI